MKTTIFDLIDSLSFTDTFIVFIGCAFLALIAIKALLSISYTLKNEKNN